MKYEHVFPVNYDATNHGGFYTVNINLKCKYCGYVQLNVKYLNYITPSCISDEEKIIKDIIE